MRIRKEDGFYHQILTEAYVLKEDFKGYIGVFDSGVGGISVLKDCTALLPNENFVFFGDSANAPYGERTVEEVQQLTMNMIRPMVERGLKAVVIACNTATSAAISLLRETFTEIPVIGVEPALKPATEDDRNGHIMVIATPVTLKLEKFQKLERTYGKDADVTAVPCPGLAGRIEKGSLDGPDLKAMMSELLGPYRGKVDSVVLGCTHYPFVRRQIREVLGDVRFYDGGEGTARELKRKLEEYGLRSDSSGEGEVVFLSSKETAEEIELYRTFYRMDTRE